MFQKQRRFPTIGILSGWSVYHTQIHPFFEHLLNAVSQAARQHDCNLLIGGSILRYASASNQVTAYGGWFAPPDISFLPIGQWNTDGLLVVTPLHSNERTTYIQSLIKQGHPVVFIGNGENGSTVYMDAQSAVYQAMQHLVNHGHTRIAFIAGEYNPDGRTDSDDKLAGYQRFVQEQGLATDPRLVAYGFQFEPGGAQAMQQILDSGVEFTAVVVSNDESAHGAISTLERAGLQVPDDIAVIGMDDHIHARARKPLLTTIHNPIEEIGTEAVLQLLRQIGGQETIPRTIRVPASLTIRESCGCVGQTRILESAPALEISLGTPGVSIPSHSRDALITAATYAVMGGGAFLSLEEVAQHAALLVDSFFMSIRANNPKRFLQALDGLCRYAFEKDDSVQPWQEALTVLQKSLQPHPRQQVDFAQQLIHHGRAAISQHLEWRGNWRMQTHINQLHQMAVVADKLISSLTIEHLVQVVTNDLEPLGIRQGWIALLNPSGDDPVGETTILGLNERHNLMFASREFPPEGFIREAAPYRRVLLPLTVGDQLLGYAIFEADNLAYCGELVQHISGALHSIRLYQQATSGQRLAEEANRVKSRFLSVVGHELRTPLSQIIGLSGLLAHHTPETVPESYMRDIAQIEATARHLNGLIADVVELGGQQNGQFQLQRETIDLLDTLAVPFATGERLAMDRGLQWQVNCPEQLPPVFADPTRIRQVALNLMSNAVKFTHSGSITVSVSADEDELTFAISDTGIGIPLDEQQRIFTEFAQSEFTRVQQYGGMGLGLAISKHIIELHGGTINVYSEVGKGATFYFTLPILPAALNANSTLPYTISTPPLDTVSPELAVGSQAKTLLIVDDQPQNLELYARMIVQYAPQYDVLRARSGVQALNTAQRYPIDLMILDLNLPDMSGADVVRTMRADSRFARIPVVILTAQPLDDVQNNLLTADNVVSILQKGMFTNEEVIDHLKRVLAKASRVGGESLRLVRAAMAFIHAHYAQPITREQIARHVAVSEDHLNRCFQHELGFSLMTYLTRYRLSQAKTLLLEGRVTVGDVANATGFGSIAYFCRVFRRETGVSPGAYRQQHFAAAHTHDL
ncbi:MAG: substrate-binding domain-containing protein [bacterium]|nr:substrate-binding domain-containing protein [bacterium]